MGGEPLNIVENRLRTPALKIMVCDIQSFIFKNDLKMSESV